MTVNTMDRVAQILRGIEKVAPTIDPDLPYDQRDTVPDYYSYLSAQRSYGVPVAVLRRFIAREMGVSDGTATRLVAQAKAEGVIQRFGASTDTRYATRAYVAEREAEAVAQDKRLASLGARLIGHGLHVTYEMDHTYQQREHAEAIRLCREQGWHISKVTLATPLEGLANLLDTGSL